MIGLLYESGEWSDYKLAAELAEMGADVRLIDAAHLSMSAIDEAVLSCDVLVNRVFASAVFRGHAAAHRVIEHLANDACFRGIPIINPLRAAQFEFSKRRATEELERAGVAVPKVWACGFPEDLLAVLKTEALAFPCIIKPDCGGRTTYTAIVHDTDEALAFLKDAPQIEFIIEEYILPEKGFITRIELCEGRCVLVVQRSVVEGGLSAYHLGSRYRIYDDCPEQVKADAERAAAALDIAFGSFDVIESAGRTFVIDANAVSNVSADNTEIFGGFDLMRTYAQVIARRLEEGRRQDNAATRG